MNLGKVLTFVVKKVVVPLAMRQVEKGKVDRDAVKDVVGDLVQREVAKRL